MHGEDWRAPLLQPALTTPPAPYTALLPADVAGNGIIVVDVWDADEDGSDDLIGKVTIPLDRLPVHDLVEATHEMIDGDIRLAVAYRPGVGSKADDGDAGVEEAGPLFPGGPDGPRLAGESFGALQQVWERANDHAPVSGPSLRSSLGWVCAR